MLTIELAFFVKKLSNIDPRIKLVSLKNSKIVYREPTSPPLAPSVTPGCVSQIEFGFQLMTYPFDLKNLKRPTVVFLTLLFEEIVQLVSLEASNI